MAAPGTPTSFNVQTGNAQNLVSWGISVGATAYAVQRSLDGVTYAQVAAPAITSYLDTDVTIGIQYWYRVAATNGSDSSPFTSAQSVVPAPTSEMSLGQIRMLSQMRADRVNSQFVTMPEWNSFINLAMDELYDLLITQYEDYFMAPRTRFYTNGSSAIFPLPNGFLTFQDAAGADVVAQPFYKLLGVDLGINANANAFVTLKKYNLIDRNRYLYNNTQSAMYGIANMQYRILGNNIEFIPLPSGNQLVQLLYIPRLPQLLQDTDISTLGFSGWLNYVICRAAKYALDKEESDTTKLDQELAFLRQRIEETAMNRDAGQPDTISDTRGSEGGWGGNGRGGFWSGSGF